MKSAGRFDFAYFLTVIGVLVSYNVANALKGMQTWELEDYNDWNLPFAKTVEIKGRKGQEGYVDTDGHGHNLGASTYKMEVDPSALFTVLFVDKSVFTDYQESDLVTLDYALIGNIGQLDPIQGVWTDCEVQMTNTIEETHESQNYTVNVTIFIALGKPPDTGLAGTLSICVTPNTDNWRLVSFMAQLEEKYSWPTIYISFYFYEQDGLYTGYVEFADETSRIDDMTFGGQIIIQDQIEEEKNIFEQNTVNPFLDLDLTQIQFRSVLLQQNQIFVTDFAKTISLLPGSAATHMPTSIYDYMNKNFF